MSRGAQSSAGLLTSAASWVAGYLRRSQVPLTMLLFLLPAMVIYELGIRWHTDQHIVAFDLLLRFFRLCGASAAMLPCLAVAGVLLTSHIARKDTWELDFRTACAMAVESAILSLPLLAIDRLASKFVPLAGLRSGSPMMIVLSMGAGVYEEFIFRLALFTLLSILLIDWLGLERKHAIPAIVCVSAFLFAGYHYLGDEPFNVQSFVFRTAAGMYFGVLFLLRGFGITVGSHIIYDIIVVIVAAR